MTRNGPGPVGLDKLEAALDTYGGDRTRWPAPLRLALSGLIAGNPEAQGMLKDAEAFDRLLDRSPQYDVARLAKLKDRIAAAAAHQPRRYPALWRLVHAPPQVPQRHRRGSSLSRWGTTPCNAAHRFA